MGNDTKTKESAEKAPAAAREAKPESQAASPAASERKMEISEVQRRLTKARLEFQEGKAKEQIQADLQALRETTETRLAEMEGKPEAQKWFQANQEVARAQTDVNLAGNSVHEQLKAIGIGGKLETAMGWMGTAGTKVAEGAQVAWEYTLKPMWEDVLKPLWDKISGIFSGMSQGTKKSMATVLRFFGLENMAKRLEGMPAGMASEDLKDLREIRGLVWPGLLTYKKPEEDVDTIVKLRANREALLREYPGLRTRYPTLTSYLDQMIKEEVQPRNGKTYTLQDLAAATEKFNGNSTKRIAEVGKEKANQIPSTASAPTTYVLTPQQTPPVTTTTAPGQPAPAPQNPPAAPAAVPPPLTTASTTR